MGDLEHRYASRSEAAQAIIVSAVLAGYTPAWLWGLAQDPGNHGIHDWLFERKNGRVRSSGDAHRRFSTSWTNAELYINSNPALRDRASALGFLAQVRDAALEPSRWKGIAGGTDRAVLLALLNRAFDACTVHPDASIRRLAEDAGISARKTVSRSLLRLHLSGWVNRVRVGDRGGRWPSTWQITLPKPGTQLTPYVHATSEVYMGSTVSSQSDVWRWRALGKTLSGYYAALSSEPVSSAMLADAFGVAIRTVRRHLARLQSFGLAEQHPEGWVQGSADLAEVARELGVHGAGDQQRAAHRRERVQHRAALARDIMAVRHAS